MDVRQQTVNAIRILSAEAIQKANSGHPGLPLGSAPIGYTIFADFLKFNPKDPKWDDRDRFVLSAGHGSMLNYSLLYLFGYDISKEDMMNFRQLGYKTPGHPEYGHTPGIETTTGPLGQGIANAVGMAVAEAHLAATFNREGFPIVDHYTYVLCGDGCLEEGISYEACSFAGTHKLGKLILFYDDNDITIEGDTDITFKEDVAMRFKAQGWQVLKVDDANDLDLLKRTVKKAKADTERPSVIICKTVIGYGSPLAGSHECHGAPLGAENLAKTKENLGWTCAPFEIPDEVADHCGAIARRGASRQGKWKRLFKEYEAAYPDLAALYKKYMSGELPDLKNDAELFEFAKPDATRNTSFAVLNKLADRIPNLIGGSADLAPSNKSNMKKRASFSAEDKSGSNMHFGIREHAMAAIANGMQLHGGLKCYCATFFIFSDYMKHAMRLSALMHQPVTYILTHDSIGVGEDGPTHEPVEQLIALRSIPGMKVYRPADGKETTAAWISALTGNAPTCLVLTRQNLPQYEKSGLEALKGGYILADSEKKVPDVLLIASGSEVEQCMQAKDILKTKGVDARVVSMPCFEEFEKQPQSYKDSVIPPEVKARVCVEAASPYSWYKYAGDYGEIIGMTTFGASGPANKLFEMFGFTADNVVEKAFRSLNKLNA
ncbi:MAG TPA: transketolase [Candidatus Borkfalkia avistercoris]|uniref:Transketolase n=1 Tax=Candidatus Borkfalkia avistercoris TaxID=2838504 RepID=A0A9D2CY97_9FIRM|nr:transketolase [Candidatus Borkfalkia avistercoris]